MSPLYDFCCRKGHVTEVRAGMEVTAISCPTCGRDAQRLSVYESQYINGETVAKAFPKATREGNIKDKHGRTRVSIFQEAAAEMDYSHTKAENEVGHTLPDPPLWKEAVKRARQVKETA